MRSILALAILIGLSMSAEARETVPDIAEQWRSEPSTLEKTEEKPKLTDIDMNVDSYLIDVARAGQLSTDPQNTQPKARRQSVQFITVLDDKTLSFGEIRILF